MPKKIHDSKVKLTLYHPLRFEIFRKIYETPFISIRKLSRELNKDFRTVHWHVNVLSKNRLVNLLKIERKYLVYPVDVFSPREIKRLALISNIHEQLILHKLNNNKKISQMQLSNEIQRSQSTISRTIKKMVENKILKVDKNIYHNKNIYHITIDTDIGKLQHQCASRFVQVLNDQKFRIFNIEFNDNVLEIDLKGLTRFSIKVEILKNFRFH